MRLLLDENMSLRLARWLSRRGYAVDHTKPLNLNSRADPVVLAFAVAHGYDAIITKDRYAKSEARLASLRAMRDGLRIIVLRFRQNTRGSGSAEKQLQLILDHREEIERAIAPDSPVRQLVLNGATGTVTRTVTVDEVAAELSRLEG